MIKEISKRIQVETSLRDNLRIEIAGLEHALFEKIEELEKVRMDLDRDFKLSEEISKKELDK